MYFVLFFLFSVVWSFSKTEDYYEILNVSTSASDDEIKKAYRLAASKYHPDINKDKNAPEMFNRVVEAYKALTENVSDENKPKLASLFIPLYLSLEKLYSGTNFKIEVKNEKYCSKCKGTGAFDRSSLKSCNGCDGKGIQTYRVSFGWGVYSNVQQTCDQCKGKGKIVTKKCSLCHGNKFHETSKVYDVEIKRGMSDNDTVVVSKAGDDYIEYQSSNFEFIIHPLKHERFNRIGNDLYATLTVGFKESLVGFTKTILHLNGEMVEIKKEGITTPNEIIQLKGNGMPLKDSYNEFGILFVSITIEYPKSLTTQQLSAIASLF